MLTQCAMKVAGTMATGNTTKEHSKLSQRTSWTVIEDPMEQSALKVRRCQFCLANAHAGGCRMRIAAHSE